MVALIMPIISTKDFASFEHHYLLDLLLNDRHEDTQESVIFVLRMHNADGSANFQKTVTEARNVNPLDVIAKHKILDAVGLAPQQVILPCWFSLERNGKCKFYHNRKRTLHSSPLSPSHCIKPLDSLFKHIYEQIKVVHKMFVPAGTEEEAFLCTRPCYRSSSCSQDPSRLSALCGY